MKPLPLLLSGAAILAAAGCNFAPHYERPATDNPPQFKEARAEPPGPDAGWKMAQPDDAAPRGPWWELYQDSDLNALEGRVAISNQTVAAAEANYRVANALVGEARGQLFPTVTVDPSVIRSRSSASGGSSGVSSSSAASGTSSLSSSGSGGPGTTRTLYTLPFEASYQVDLWGRIRNTVAQSKYDSEASAADVANALLSTQSQLAQDYFQLRTLDEERRILDTTLADYQASLHLVKTLFNNGLASDEDLAEADTQLDSAEAQATDLGVVRAEMEHAIAVLIGVPPAEFSLSVKPFRPKIPEVPLAVPADLLERRPDIAAAERSMAAANAGIGIARAAFFPNLSLAASAGYEATGLSRLFDYPNRFWSIGPTAAQTLFEGGALRAAVAQAHAQYDETVANYRQTVLSAFGGVEDNLSTLQILYTEVRQQHRAAAAAEREVRLSVERYKDGLDSYVNVITAQNTFLTNREAELQVELRQITASVNLVINLGGGWQASQTGQTERTAMHPPEAGKPATIPPSDAASVPNPAPLPNSVANPDEILKQNEADMAPAPGR